MEETLEGYQRPYDEPRPRVCFEEGTKQWVKDVREPLPVAPGRLERIDYEYERHGTGNLCMMFEPLAGRREVLVTARRRAVDSAEAIRPLVDVCHPKADQRSGTAAVPRSPHPGLLHVDRRSRCLAKQP